MRPTHAPSFFNSHQSPWQPPCALPREMATFVALISLKHTHTQTHTHTHTRTHTHTHTHRHTRATQTHTHSHARARTHLLGPTSFYLPHSTYSGREHLAPCQAEVTLLPANEGQLLRSVCVGPDQRVRPLPPHPPCARVQSRASPSDNAAGSNCRDQISQWNTQGCLYLYCRDTHTHTHTHTHTR